MINGKVFWGIVTAAAAGAVIGMLFAPDEGTQTRKKIKRKTNSLASELIEALEKSKDKVVKSAEDLKEKGQKYKNDLHDKAEELADDAAQEVHKYN
ncbi:YtxH domain-containing protein [Dyadobacter sp. LHD-138]|uniref:YtxH domain-containing protein n=1 Tax=Dyadobacter sp. LHD-138 TaxID=3071413 RepID=UPI0027DFD452|nr:YtxH domain-containing protein [Dyadobacter sp. LHD-138]MDQ6477330.1 YtxH domain-containing protein [Dyadobacter sp. LHD-138]